MLKKMSIKKIIVSTTAIILLLVIYLIPSNRKDIDLKKIYSITAQQESFISLGNESHPYTYKNLLDYFVFLDGTPCGILNY